MPKNTQGPDSYLIGFAQCFKEAPLPSVLIISDQYEIRRTYQQYWSLYVKSLRARPLHPLGQVLKKWKPRTKMEGFELQIHWKELPPEVSLTDIIGQAIQRRDNQNARRGLESAAQTAARIANGLKNGNQT